MSAEPAAGPGHAVRVLGAHDADRGEGAHDAGKNESHEASRDDGASGAGVVNPLRYLLPSDFAVLSSVAGRSINATSTMLPVLAAQIGLDRRSSALPQSEAVSPSYFKAIARRYRHAGILSVGVLGEIDRAIAHLVSAAESAAAAAGAVEARSQRS